MKSLQGHGSPSAWWRVAMVPGLLAALLIAPLGATLLGERPCCASGRCQSGCCPKPLAGGPAKAAVPPCHGGGSPATAAASHHHSSEHGEAPAARTAIRHLPTAQGAGVEGEPPSDEHGHPQASAAGAEPARGGEEAAAAAGRAGAATRWAALKSPATGCFCPTILGRAPVEAPTWAEVGLLAPADITTRDGGAEEAPLQQGYRPASPRGPPALPTV